MSSLIHKLTVKCTQGATLVERRREKATNLESHRDYPLDEITTLNANSLIELCVSSRSSRISADFKNFRWHSFGLFPKFARSVRVRLSGHNCKCYLGIIIQLQHEVFASRGDSEKNPSSRWDSNPRPSVI